MSLNDIIMTNSICTTVVEVKKKKIFMTVKMASKPTNDNLT